MADPNLIKWCNKGKHYLSLEHFAKDRNRKDGLQPYCRSCMAANHAANKAKYLAQRKHHYQKNKEQISAKNKAWRDANKEHSAEYFKAYHRVNKSKRLAYNKERYQANKERHNSQGRAWRENNRERLLDYFKQYRKQNPEVSRAGSRNHKARKKNAPGRFTSHQWLDKCAYYGWRCIYCHVSLTHENIQIEHRKPLSRGGSNWIANIAPACKSCNLSKNNKTEREYRKSYVK